MRLTHFTVGLILTISGCSEQGSSNPSLDSSPKGLSSSNPAGRLNPSSQIPQPPAGQIPLPPPVASKSKSADKGSSSPSNESVSPNSLQSSDMPAWIRHIPRAACPHGPIVSPPAWEVPGANLEPAQDILRLRANQQRYLEMFRGAVDTRDWNRIHHDHFDWWQFPCDFGSQREFNLKSEADIQRLQSDPEWRADYLESVRLVSRAFGWDVEAARFIADDSGGQWRPDKDIRLAKMIRSLWLFGELQYFESLRAFARIIQARIYHGGAFVYAGRCYDEITIMTLPRPIPYH